MGEKCDCQLGIDTSDKLFIKREGCKIGLGMTMPYRVKMKMCRRRTADCQVNKQERNKEREFKDKQQGLVTWCQKKSIKDDSGS